MIAKNLLTTIAFAFVLLFSGCAKDDFVEIDGVCPLVISTVPTNGAVGVPLNQIITATFNEVMKTSTITAASFLVSANGAQIGGTVTYAGSTATFTPNSPLLPNTEYTGTITTLASDPNGNFLQENYVWTFTTLGTFTVAVSPLPNNTGTITGGGTFLEGTTVNLVATPNDPAQYVFDNWTEGGVIIQGEDNTYTFVLGEDRTLVANFVPAQYTIDLSADPVEAGTATGTIGGVAIISGTGYNYGSSVTLTATSSDPDQYVFSNWTEGGVIVPGALAEYTFELTESRELVANFVPVKYEIILSVLPDLVDPLFAGTVTGAGTFDYGTTQTVTAAPGNGYVFVNWTNELNGEVVSSSPAYIIPSLTENINLVANFILDPTTYTLLLEASPIEGGSVGGGGEYSKGEIVPVSALADIDNGYRFVNWTKDNANGVVVSTDPNFNYTITEDTTLVANFEKIQYQITLSVDPLLTGTTTGAGTFDAGTTRTVTADPEDGYVFENWTENGNILVGEGDTYTFELTEDRNLVAHFSLIPTTQYSLVLRANPIEGGTVAGGGLFDQGTLVPVTASIKDGYTFVNWTNKATGLVVSLNPNFDYLLTGNTTLVANFELDTVVVPSGTCPNPAVNLGMAKDYAILAESAISTTGVTSITGDMGLSPLAASFITGFALTLDPSGTFSTSDLVTGKVYAANYTSPTPSNVGTAVADMHTAFTTANGMAPSSAANINAYDGNIAGQTLASGVYKWTTGLLVTNSIILDGGGNDCAPFVFQIDGDLTIANNTEIILINGAKADNIFWVTAGAGAKLGTDVIFKGNILSKTLISLQQRSTVNGRLLAQTAVTLIGNTVVKPSN